jgi:hypothetical protein
MQTNSSTPPHGDPLFAEIRAKTLGPFWVPEQSFTQFYDEVEPMDEDAFSKALDALNGRSCP